MIKHTYKPDTLLWEYKTFSDDRQTIRRIFSNTLIDFDRTPSKQYSYILTNDLRLLGPDSKDISISDWI